MKRAIGVVSRFPGSGALGVRIPGEGEWCIGLPNSNDWPVGQAVLVKYVPADQWATVLELERLQAALPRDARAMVAEIPEVGAKELRRNEPSLQERVFSLVDEYGVAEVLQEIADECSCRSSDLIRRSCPQPYEAQQWQSVAEAVEEAQKVAKDEGV